MSAKGKTEIRGQKSEGSGQFDTVVINPDRHGIPTATIDASAFCNPDLAVARQLIALGQLIEELSLSAKARREP